MSGRVSCVSDICNVESWIEMDLPLINLLTDWQIDREVDRNKYLHSE